MYSICVYRYRYTCVYVCLCMHILILENIYNGLYVTKQKHKLTTRRKKTEKKITNIIKIFKTVEISPAFFFIKNNQTL